MVFPLSSCTKTCALYIHVYVYFSVKVKKPADISQNKEKLK